MMAGVVLTALYMTRQIIYVFFGNRRAASELATGRVRPTGGHEHESPSVMTTPLIVLAVCSIVLSVVLTPAWPWLHSYLAGEPAHFNISLLIQPMLFVSLALVVAGIGLGFVMYGKAGREDRHRGAETDPLEHAQPALFRFLENKMWLDELYERTVVTWSAAAARVSDWMDRYFWDGLVRVFGGVGQLFGILSTNFDERGINAGADEATTGTRDLGRVMSAWHSGQIQTYLSVVAVGMLALLILYAWLA